MLGKTRQKCTRKRTHKDSPPTTNGQTQGTRNRCKNLCPRSANQTGNENVKPKSKPINQITMKKVINLFLAALVLCLTFAAAAWAFCVLPPSRHNMFFITAGMFFGIMLSGYFFENWKEVNI